MSWLYGLASNVAAGMYRQRARAARAERQLAGGALLDADDVARVEERIAAAVGHPTTSRAVTTAATSP